MSTEVLGFIASGLYAGYLATLLAVGPLAAATYGLTSRAAWLAFAAASLAVAVLNAALLPHGFDGLRETESVGWPGLGWFWCAASAPLGQASCS